MNLTPSSILSRAADLIRDTAAAASAGPWKEPYWDGNPGDQGWWILNGLEGACESAVCSTFSLNKQGEADARWIALMSPAVAPMIIQWLREAAEMCHEWDDQMTEAAIAFARAVLGIPEETTSNNKGELK